jgi:hypothetical protein
MESYSQSLGWQRFAQVWERQTCETKHTFSCCTSALAAGIVRNWRAMTEMRGKRVCPTSLHQTRTSTSWVMSDPSSFLPITTLLWIAGIVFPALFCQLPISVVICHLKLTARSAKEIRSCTTNDTNQMSYKVSVWPQHEEGEKLTCCARESMEMPPDTLEAVGVNELFVTVTRMSMHLLQQNRQW